MLVENHKLDEREQQQKGHRRLSSNGVTMPYISEYLERFLPPTLDLLGFSEAELYLKKEKSPLLVRVFHYGKTREFLWKEEQAELGKSSLGKIAQTVEPSVIDLTKTSVPGINEHLVKNGYRHVLCFPMRAEIGLVGMLCLADANNNPLDEKTENMLKQIAANIGSMVQHEQKSLEDKRSLVREERERIGMDLHDGIIQSLYGVGLSLQNVLLQFDKNREESREHINAALDAINESIRDIRAYILDLRPRQLRGQDLYTGIESLLREFRANTLIDVELKKDVEHIERLPEEDAEILFHVCQEALGNIAKHAKASKVTVRLWETQQRVMLRVSDNGVGFDKAKVNQHLGHGISNMTSRVEAVGGGIEIIPIRHQGTTVLVWLPLHD